MIDAGHGGHDSGAVGPTGLREKDVAISVAMILGSLLATDFVINYTRRGDQFIELAKRADLANEWNADSFVSIHCNSGPPGQGSGFEVFTTLGESPSDQLATCVFNAYGTQFPSKARRMDLADGDPDKEAGFAVIRLTKMKAILFELEFIHTPEGEDFLKNPLNQALCARAIANGIRAFYGMQQEAAPSPAAGGDRKLMELDVMSVVEKASASSAALFAGAKTELEAIFRKQ